MGNSSRRIIRNARRHHGGAITANYRSVRMDDVDDYMSVFGIANQSLTDFDSVSLNNYKPFDTAYAWRLPGSTDTIRKDHVNNAWVDETDYDWSSNALYNPYGETAMSVAFWVKPHADNMHQWGKPVEHGTYWYYSTWRTIFYSAPVDSLLNAYCGIWIAVFNAGAGSPGGQYPGGGDQKNYFMMGKGAGRTGNAGKVTRVGTTTPINAANQVFGTDAYTAHYVSTWYHIAASWGTANPNSWKMWINGVEQVNANHGGAFDHVDNPGYRSNEAGVDHYSPYNENWTDGSGTGVNHLAGQYAGDPGAGWNSRETNCLGMNITDFSYWHAELEASDVGALWNNGVRFTRDAPIADFTVSY